MKISAFKRIPTHVGIIPDGNRRWAVEQGFTKEKGYDYGIEKGEQLCNICSELGIKEITFYGFTQDNTKRPSVQTKAFTEACVKSVQTMLNKDANILVVGNRESELFPKALEEYSKRTFFGEGKINVNFLVNYGWKWDIQNALKSLDKENDLMKNIASNEISRIDLIVRWGGRRRLSGFLPIQSVYSDFYVVDKMWPDFEPEQFLESIQWYQSQDVTLGG